MQLIDIMNFDEERALYGLKDCEVRNCSFDGPADGESALKECSRIKVDGCRMNLRYPFWHLADSELKNCNLTENCRAPLWYDSNICVSGCNILGTKAVRECDRVRLTDSTVNSLEFIWKSRNLIIEDVTIENSEYPFFEVSDSRILRLDMKGKYSFQYCSNISIEKSNLDTKDAFWHSKNLVIKDCVVKGEYLAWYSENLYFINCRIIGTQPFCYCKNLVLENCTMEGCDLSFERSSVRANVNGRIESVKNVLSGSICADEIGIFMSDDSVVDVNKTEIKCDKIEKVERLA